MPTKKSLGVLVLMLLPFFPLAASAQLMIIGNDEKVTWDDTGKLVLMGPGYVAVGDGPEGFVIRPTGEIAVAILLWGSKSAKTAWFCNRNGSVAVWGINGRKVTKVGEVEVGGLPDGAVFSRDRKYLYVGNFLDSDVSILRVEGTKVTDTGKPLQLPGHPASTRGRAR